MLDVALEALVADPIGTVRAISAAADFALDPDEIRARFVD